jgi:hemolysin activation/secretion protein
LNIGLGWQASSSGKASAPSGITLGDAKPLPPGGRGSVLHGRKHCPAPGIAGGFSLSGFRLVLPILFLMLALGAPAHADTPAVTKVRVGTHDFGERLVLDLSAGGARYRVLPAGADGALVIQFDSIDWYPATDRALGGLIDSYEFKLDGAAGGRLILLGARSLHVLNSFPLSPTGESGHRLVFDLAESPGAPTAAAGPRREAPPVVHGTPPAAPPEPSPRAPTVTSLAELPSLETAEPLAVDGGDASRPTDPLATDPAGTEAADEEKRFQLRSLTVDGATVVKSAELRHFYAAKLGQPVSLKDLNDIADKITAAMRNKGYLLYKVIVPKQEITAGRVRLQAIEGYINEVIVETEGKGQFGSAGRPDLWHAWIQRIKSERPITTEVLERYTLLANDLAGKTVKSVLRPAKGVPGASDLVLKVTEKRFDVSATIDNRASPTTGPHEATVVASANGAFGVGEKVTLTYNMAADRDQQEYTGLQMEMPLTAEGTTATVSGTISTSAPGDVLKDLELTSESFTFSASLAHPLVRRRDETLKVYGGFSYTDSQSDALSSRLYEDKLRTLNAGLAYSLKDSWDGENSLDLGMTQGFEWLGASEEDTDLRSRSNGQNDFTKLTLSASRLQRLPKNFSMSATFTGQWASAPLLSSEEFDFGGSSYGRAFDSSEITGDHGMALALELQYTMQPGVPYLKYLQPYAFWDIGATWDIDADDSSANRSGASAGLGLRFGLTDHFSAGLEIAKPLTREVSSADDGEGDDPRFFFTLTGLY